MKIIRLHEPYDKNLISSEPIVLAMGFFDGVHLGHQRVLKKAVEIGKENNQKVAAMTFDHHASVVFQNKNQKFSGLSYLTSVNRKAELMKNIGVDLLYVVDFTSALGSLSPDTFVQEYMVDLHAKTVVAGFDYTYGPANVANMENLPKFADKRFKVVKIDKFDINQKKVGSSLIRNLITDGNIDDANKYLGYSFQTQGVVVHGEARGRTLGFPTANIVSSENQIIPGIGIYVVMIKIGHKWYQGMASVGKNIVFGSGRPVTTEINILDFHQAIYGETAKIKWIHRLRGEENFASVADLVVQLHQDEADTRNFLKKYKGV